MPPKESSEDQALFTEVRQVMRKGKPEKKAPSTDDPISAGSLIPYAFLSTCIKVALS
jgi:hypothetical protein